MFDKERGIDNFLEKTSQYMIKVEKARERYERLKEEIGENNSIGEEKSRAVTPY